MMDKSANDKIQELGIAGGTATLPARGPQMEVTGLITIYGGSDPGLTRKVNQDRCDFGVLSELLAYAVLCDGMGGPGGGHIASETATRFVSDMLARDLKPEMSESSIRAVMLSAAAGANALVYDAAQTDPELAGMGTTLIIAVFSGDQMFVAYAGDSRVYHIGGGEEVQLTKDHTVVQMLLDMGEITEQDAPNHPKRHYITRAVGVSPTVETDFLEHSFRPGDLALLCSDGLYNYVSPQLMTGEALGALLRQSLEEGGVDNLIRLALDGGGGDNVTVIVVGRAPEDSQEDEPENGASVTEPLTGEEN